jgi:hypothetical protein
VDAEGEYHLGATGGNGVLTYYNEAGATVVTLVLTGLDVGGVALNAGNLEWTA